jgi:fructokinase
MRQRDREGKRGFRNEPKRGGAGRSVVGLLRGRSASGGAPANVAYHAAQHGHPGVVYSRVGRDPLGDALVEYLASKGVGTQTIQRDDAHPTGTVTVDASDPNDPRYVIHEDVAWDHLAITPQTEALMRSAGAVCFGTLAQRHPASRATIHRALDAAQGALRVYDVNLRQAWYAREWVEASLARADVVKLNRDEVGVLDGLLAIDAGDPVGFCQHGDGSIPGRTGLRHARRRGLPAGRCRRPRRMSGRIRTGGRRGGRG